MRTVALIASVLVLTGSAPINAQHYENASQLSWGEYCQDSSCGEGFRSGYGPQVAGPAAGGRFIGRRPRIGGGVFTGQGACASGGCDTNSNTVNFSDFDCGPMCGAYLTDQQTQISSCDCDSCNIGNSYVRNQFGHWRGQGSTNRPLAGVGTRRAALAPARTGLLSRDGASSVGLRRGAPTPAPAPHSDLVGASAGPCRGLGAMVGCFGCQECGSSNAIGMNHSEYSENLPSGQGHGCSCGLSNCPGGHNCLAKAKSHGVGLLSRFFRFGGTPHPYGGELPHTASASADSGFGAAAPAYAYPYYTTRGPRDFLMMSPPSIGR